MDKKNKRLTRQQQKALHLMFKQLSDTLNEAGLDVRATLSKDLYHPWSGQIVKEIIWRKVQHSMTGKKSTTELTTDEIDKIFDVIIKYLGENFGLDTKPFPSIETLMNDIND